MRIAILFDNLGPYHYARLNASASRAEVFGIETIATSLEYQWKTDVRARFERVTLYNGAQRTDVAVRLGEALSRCSPDVVASPGWSGGVALAALKWCLHNRIPAVVMSESAAGDEKRSAFKEGVKRQLIALFGAALAGGSRHVAYLEALGMPRERIFTGYDAVDNEYFAQRAKELQSRKDKLRSSYSLPENYFLASARFVGKKNLPALIRAYAAYRGKLQSTKDEGRSWELVLLGDGPLRPDLERLISELQLSEHVHLPGFKQYDELPIYYGLAKAFVHASTTEQWGLVVNEAMASGLPVIVSERCGCVPELVHDGVNGFTFDPYNQEQITDNLLTMTALHESERIAFGEASQRIVGGYGVGQFADGLLKAAELAVSLPRKRASIVDRALLAALICWGARAPSRAG